MKFNLLFCKFKAVLITLAICLFANSILKAQDTPMKVILTGFNADVIADAGLNQNILTVTTTGIDGPNGYSFYEQGYSNNSTAIPDGGLPSGGSFTTNAGHPFQLAPYNGSNDLQIAVGNTGKLIFDASDQLPYDSLFVMVTGGGGEQVLDYTIYFTDNTSTTGTFYSNDWGCGCDDTAIGTLGRVSLIGGNGGYDAASGNVFSIWESSQPQKIILTAPDNTKLVDSITFVLPTGGGAAGLANIFAITGYTSTPLPVTLASFTVTPVNGKALLQWKTSQELNNKQFIIKRASGNDPNAFVQVGEVPATSSPSGSSYSFSDNPGASGTYYYQLLQEDIDGNIKSLGVKSITFNAGTTWVVEDIGSQWKLICAQPFMYRLLDLQGRVLAAASGSGSASISKPDAYGIYQLQVQTGGVFSTQKLMK